MNNGSRNGVDRFRLYLASVHASVRASDVLEDTLLVSLVVEDTCWRIAEQSWIARQPRRWQLRKVHKWRAERTAVCEQREQVRALARFCGLIVV